MTGNIEFFANWKDPNTGRMFLRGQVYAFFKTEQREFWIPREETIPIPIAVKRHKCEMFFCTHFFILDANVEYIVPDQYAAITNKALLQDGKSIEQRFVEKVTTDAYEENGSTDYVAAAKDFFGIDIAAKPIGDQADYETPESVLKMIEDKRNENVVSEE